MSDTQTLRLQPPVWALLVSVLLGGCFYVYGKSMESVQRTVPTISVSGEGKVSAVPDIAEMSFGVRVERQRDAKTAMTMLSKQMQAVYDAVQRTGIDTKDIRTEQLSLSPSYDWTNGRQQLLGYEASQMLRVKVRDLQKTSDVLGAATGAGANQANDVQFTIDDPESLQAQAREEAIEQAKEKARVLAQQLDMSLGKVQSFSEGGNGYSPPMPMMMRAQEEKAMDASAGAPPLPEGQQEVQVTVSMTYELK